MSTLLERQPDPSAKVLRCARAFSAGSDARLAGLPLAACPCRHSDEQSYWWRQGWWDVAKFWGADALWQHLDLPPVEEAP